MRLGDGMTAAVVRTSHTGPRPPRQPKWRGGHPPPIDPRHLRSPWSPPALAPFGSGSPGGCRRSARSRSPAQRRRSSCAGGSSALREPWRPERLLPVPVLSSANGRSAATVPTPDHRRQRRASTAIVDRTEYPPRLFDSIQDHQRASIRARQHGRPARHARVDLAQPTPPSRRFAVAATTGQVAGHRVMPASFGQAGRNGRSTISPLGVAGSTAPSAVRSKLNGPRTGGRKLPAPRRRHAHARHAKIGARQ